MEPSMLQYGSLGLLAVVLVAVGRWVSTDLREHTHAIRAMNESLGQVLVLVARLNNVPAEQLAGWLNGAARK